MGNCLPGGARGLAQGFVEDRLSETIDDTTENIGSKAVNHQSTFDYPRVTRPNGLFLNPRYLDANPCRKPCIYVFSTLSLIHTDAADDLLCVDLGGRRIIKK